MSFKDLSKAETVINKAQDDAKPKTPPAPADKPKNAAEKPAPKS